MTTPEREPLLSWNVMDWRNFKLPEYTEVWVSDGKQVRLAEVERRFGTPMSFYENRGGKFQIIESVPKWLRVWRFADLEAPENFCSSGNLPRDEIDFMVTHWMLRQTKPAPPSSAIRAKVVQK